MPGVDRGKIRRFSKDYLSIYKSHAAAYAVIGCQTAWLKAYYPAEFYAALLSSVMGQDKRVSRYIEECTRRGIVIEPPDVNHSERKFTVKDGKIIFGLGAVKNVGAGFIDSIIKSRKEYGPFTSLLDFCERVDNINKRALTSLIKAGAFDFYDKDRGTLLINAYDALSRGQQLKKIKLSGQESFFGGSAFSQAQSDMEMIKAEPLPPESILSMEKEVLGLYLSGHPLRKYQNLLERKTVFNLGLTESYEDLSRVAADQSFVTLGGLIENIRTQLTKKGDLMAFARLEDQFGGIDLVIFPAVFDKFRAILKEDYPVLVYGKISYDEEMNVSLIVDNIELLEDSQTNNEVIGQPFRPLANKVKVDQNALTVCLSDLSQKPLISNIKKVLKSFPGQLPVILYFEKENKRFKASESLNVQATEQLVNELNNVLGNNYAEVY